MKKAKQYKPKLHKAKRKFVANSNKRNARKYGYDRVWDAYRFRFLHYNPNCYICPNRANVVDHYQAHKGDMELFKSLTNHIPLCTRCHGLMMKYDKSNPPLYAEKTQYIHKIRKERNITVRVVPLDVYDKKEKKRGQ
jgi:5-methylcytosine-specific restriction endonuclease McrA